MNIYELHLGSWKTKDNEWYTYNEIAEDLISYLKKAAIWELDHTYDGFKWIKCVFGYIRTNGKQSMLALFNFSDKEAFISPILDKKVSMLLNTDWQEFGGNTIKSLKRSLPQTIPAFTGILFTYQ